MKQTKPKCLVPGVAEFTAHLTLALGINGLIPRHSWPCVSQDGVCPGCGTDSAGQGGGGGGNTHTNKQINILGKMALDKVNIT